MKSPCSLVRLFLQTDESKWNLPLSKEVFVAALWTLPFLLFLFVMVGLELRMVFMTGAHSGLLSAITIFPALLSVLLLNISNIQCAVDLHWAGIVLQTTLNFQLSLLMCRGHFRQHYSTCDVSSHVHGFTSVFMTVCCFPARHGGQCSVAHMWVSSAIPDDTEGLSEALEESGGPCWVLCQSKCVPHMVKHQCGCMSPK